MTLIDSSIYIGWLRQKQSPALLLQTHTQRGEVLSCGVVRAEVLRGVTNPAAREDLTDFFDLLPEIPTTPAVWNRITGLAWELDRTGLVLPLPDLIIAACAMSVDAGVVSTDDHFNKIPGLKVRHEL